MNDIKAQEIIEDNTARIFMNLFDESTMQRIQEKAAEGQTKVNIIVPSNKIFSLLQKDEIYTVELSIAIPKAIMEQTNISLQEMTLKKKVLQELSSTGKKATIAITDEDGKNLYAITLDGKEFSKQKDVSTSLNLAYALNHKDSEMTLTANKETNLPYPITIDVHTELLKNEKVYVYYEHDGKLLERPQTQYLVGENGVVAIHTNRIGNLVICSEPKKDVVSLEEQISVSNKKQTVATGKKTNMKLVIPAELNSVQEFSADEKTAVQQCKITYTSSNSKIASVSKDGKITGKKSGKAKISAKIVLADGRTKTVSMTVQVKS